MMLATPRTVSSLRSASTVPERAASGARWVTTTREASPSVLALLADRVDRYAVLGEDRRDLGEHARLVGHVEADVVPRHHVAHGAHGQLGVRGLAGSGGLGELVAADGDEVAEDRGGGGRAARARTVEHQLPGGLGLDEDGVVRLADGGERVAERDHRGVHAGGDGLPVGGALADGEELDGAAHALGGGDVGGGDLGQALAVDVVEAYAGVEGDPGEDGGLGGGVEALDVGGRVGLGVSEGGGLVERLGVAGAGACPSCRG